MEPRRDLASSSLPKYPSGAMPALARTGSGFGLGLRYFGRGFGTFFRSPRFVLLSMIPAILSLTLVVGGLFALFYFIDDVSAAVTWFANDWSSEMRDLVRVLAAVAIGVVAVLVAVFTYTAITLIIGDPFYESISEKVEERLGGAPDTVELPWYKSMWPNAKDSVRLLLVSLCVSVPLLILGFIPVVGQTAVPVVDAVFGGWMIALEVTGIAFNRRGMRLRDRRRLFRQHRAMVLGFGIPIFLLLLVPLAAILVIPASVAGGTLLARHLLGLPNDRKAAR